MRCPFFYFLDTRVIDSIPTEDFSIRRRRECDNCHNRFTTYEKIEQTPILVVKKDGTRQPFDRNKIMKGLIASCVKRPVTSKDLENLMNDIEKDIYNLEMSEIDSRQIGEIVLKKLKKIDEVAYVRFASVYREFKEVSNFGDEVARMKK
ncbi:MAG: transcriptional regulator NrdR [Lachnospiraceae bacterium]|nr:transcriptional regulator NrdR [Lachnospiraceae bacterium]